MKEGVNFFFGKFKSVVTREVRIWETKMGAISVREWITGLREFRREAAKVEIGENWYVDFFDVKKFNWEDTRMR